MSDEPKADALKRDRLETVTYERPKCPACGSIELVKTRSVHDQGDGIAMWGCGVGAHVVGTGLRCCWSKSALILTSPSPIKWISGIVCELFAG